MGENLPYMPLWVSDFLGSARVRELPGETQGLYLLALVLEWGHRGKGLPADDETLARSLSLSTESWAEHRAGILQFFDPGPDGRLHNEALKGWWKWANGRANARSRAGKIGAEARWQTDGNRIADANADANGKPDGKPMASQAQAQAQDEDQDEEPPSPPNAKRARKRSTTAEIDFDAVVNGWNEIASAEDLPTIGQIGDTRKRKLACRLRDDPELLPKLAEEIKRRGAWARENRFPSFDQCLQPSTLEKLLDGNYRPKPAEIAKTNGNPDADERQQLVRRLQRHHGKRTGNDTGIKIVGVDGYTNFSGFDTPYSKMSIGSLKNMIQELENK